MTGYSMFLKEDYFLIAIIRDVLYLILCDLLKYFKANKANKVNNLPKNLNTTYFYRLYK